MLKYQDDSLAGQPITRDGLSMGCPAMPFGSRIRELERKFMSKTTCIRLGEGGGDMLHHRSRQVVGD